MPPRSNPPYSSPTATALKTVWLLCVLVSLAGFSYEILELNDLYASQRFLLPVVQLTFASWALIEMVVLGRREKNIPLTGLHVALAAQLLAVIARLALTRLTDREWNAAHFLLGVAAIYVPLYSIVLLVISKLLVDAFSFTERQRSIMLQNEIQTRVDAEAALQSANAELQRLATTDHLTGARNRTYLNDVLIAEHARAQRDRRAVSLLMIDVDHFKTINDTFGHPAGDQVLIELIARISDNIRGGDVVARAGGEEFVVVLPHCGLEEAQAVAEKLRLVIADRPVPPAGSVTVSVGVAAFRPGESVQGWLDRADAALYEAKRGGRDRVCLAGPGISGR